MDRRGRQVTGWGNVARARLRDVGRWLDRTDPGAHRRVKGLRLITAYGIAAMLGTMGDITRGLQGGSSLAALAGGFALWASVSEGRGTRRSLAGTLFCLPSRRGWGRRASRCLGRRLPGSVARGRNSSWCRAPFAPAICAASA